MVVDATGLPVFFLSEWYRRKKAFDTGRTPETYLEMLLPWAGFLLQKKYAWNAPPERVRAYLIEFLRQDVGCQIGPAPEDGYLVETTGASPLSKSSLGVLLAALTSLYDVLADASCYRYQNPMRSERLAALKREHLRHVKNAGAPDHAGIRSETHRETYQAYPTTFLRQKRGKIWEPEVIMEPDAVQQRMRKTIDFMIQHATFQRDQIVLLLLRQTGARLSEIVEMTIGGWRSARHGGRALVKNKGSHGREEKLVYFSDVIEEQLQKYIRTERATCDPQGRKQLDQLNDRDPLFLTEDGRPYTRSSFYYHWRKLFEPAQKQFSKQDRVEFSPHDIRHLRVSRAITKIKRDAKGDKEIEEELTDGFWRLMGWRSRDTMDIYTHVFSKRHALVEVMLKDEDEQDDLPIQPGIPVPIADMQQHPMEPSLSLSAISTQGDEDFSWYEE
jgi:site-specific recombinase XerC